MANPIICTVAQFGRDVLAVDVLKMCACKITKVNRAIKQ